MGAEVTFIAGLRWLLFLGAVLVPVPTYAQTCKVLDPELVGTYSGGCKDGYADGLGQATGIASYTGEFRSGRKHGRGIKRWPWGDRYEGEFVDDRKQGSGTYIWGVDGPWAGEKYSGAFMADWREGLGTYSWPTGETYTGLWSQDQLVGSTSSVLFERILAHARADAEAMVAVGRPGVRVCRPLRIGIGTDDWISGDVVDTKGFAISIRIENPGRFSVTLNGVNVTRGTVIWDAAPSWMPCRA